jgi:hypothetical protein
MATIKESKLKKTIGRTRFPPAYPVCEKLTVNQTPTVTVIGKAFFDIGHAPKDQSNRKKPPAGLAGNQ